VSPLIEWDNKHGTVVEEGSSLRVAAYVVSQRYFEAEPQFLCLMLECWPTGWMECELLNAPGEIVFPEININGQVHKVSFDRSSDSTISSLRTTALSFSQTYGMYEGGGCENQSCVVDELVTALHNAINPTQRLEVDLDFNFEKCEYPFGQHHVEAFRLPAPFSNGELLVDRFEVANHYVNIKPAQLRDLSAGESVALTATYRPRNKIGFSEAQSFVSGGEAAGQARIGVSGKAQLDLLTSFFPGGWRPHHSLLEFGCGTLGLATAAAPMLFCSPGGGTCFSDDRGGGPLSYGCVEPNDWLVTVGLDNQPDGVDSPAARNLMLRATLRGTASFSFNSMFDVAPLVRRKSRSEPLVEGGDVGEGFSAVIAHSVLSHIGSSQLGLIFRSVASTLTLPDANRNDAGGVGMFSMCICAPCGALNLVRSQESGGGECQESIASKHWVYPFVTWWCPERISSEAEAAGLRVIGLGGRGQGRLNSVVGGFGGEQGSALVEAMRTRMLRAQLAPGGTGDNDWHDWLVVVHANASSEAVNSLVNGATERLHSLL